MELKKLICAYLTVVLFLTGCGNLKSQIKGNQNTDASADQPTGSIIKRDNNEIVEVERVEKQEENKSALVNIENNDDNLNGADGNNQNDDNNQSKSPSEELEPTWQGDTAKKYAYKTGHFLYEHKEYIYSVVILVTYLLWREHLLPQQNHPAQMWQQLQNHVAQAQFNLQQLNQDQNMIQQFQQIQDQVQIGIDQIQVQMQQMQAQRPSSTITTTTTTSVELT